MIFTVEGNIGVGKTTFLKALEATNFTKQHVVVFEPVDSWMAATENGEKSLFELYYHDKMRYGFTFQMMALQTRFDNLIKMCNENVDTIIICERSFLTDYQIFATMMHHEGFITDIQMSVYKKWHDFIMNLIKPDVKGIIYLHADPSVCMTRVQKRKRVGEEVITHEYLRMLHDRHESWLGEPTGLHNVLRIDATEQPDIASVVDFINKSLTLSST